MVRIAGWGVALVVLTGCVRSQSVDCGDGLVCAAGTTCDIEHRQCLRDDQRTSCAELAEGDLCPIGEDTGVCRDGLCLRVVCGDGFVQLDEECDGSPPSSSCVDDGFDAGALGCDNRICVADRTSCRRLGWKTVPTPGINPVLSLSGVPGLGLAARNVVLQYTGTSWAPIFLGEVGRVHRVYVASTSSAFALTEKGLYRYDGSIWTFDPVLGSSVEVGVVFGSGPNDVFVVGQTPTLAAFHLDAQG